MLKDVEVGDSAPASSLHHHLALISLSCIGREAVVTGRLLVARRARSFLSCCVLLGWLRVIGYSYSVCLVPATCSLVIWGQL